MKLCFTWLPQCHPLPVLLHLWQFPLLIFFYLFFSIGNDQSSASSYLKRFFLSDTVVSKTQDVSRKSSQERNEVSAAVQKLHINLQSVLSMFLTLTNHVVYNNHSKIKKETHIHNSKLYYYNLDLIYRPIFTMSIGYIYHSWLKNNISKLNSANFLPNVLHLLYALSW